MCAYKSKAWVEKLDVDKHAFIEKPGKDFAGIKAGQMMQIPYPGWLMFISGEFMRAHK